MEFQIATRKSSRRSAKKIKPEHYLFLTSQPYLEKIYKLMPILFVPDPILQHIISFLDGWNLVTCKSVCKKFNQIISNNQTLCLRIIKTKEDYEEEEIRIWSYDIDDSNDYEYDHFNYHYIANDWDDRYD
jgi:hypothetical protein